MPSLVKPSGSSARLEELAAVEGIIFDLDGTLWDASSSATKAWNRALTECGYNDHLVTVEELRAFTGIKIETILEEKFAFMGKKGIKDFFAVYREVELEEMRKGGGLLYPEVESALRALSRTKKLFIVSNCLVGYIENFFQHSLLGKYFTGYESTGRTGKPKHENIRKVIRDYSLETALYIGDTENDYRECEKAGIPFVHASYGFGKAEGAIYRIERATDLLLLR
jgi:phosphoglycolate phosphatase